MRGFLPPPHSKCHEQIFPAEGSLEYNTVTGISDRDSCLYAHCGQSWGIVGSEGHLGRNMKLQFCKTRKPGFCQIRECSGTVGISVLSSDRQIQTQMIWIEKGLLSHKFQVLFMDGFQGIEYHSLNFQVVTSQEGIHALCRTELQLKRFSRTEKLVQLRRVQSTTLKEGNLCIKVGHWPIRQQYLGHKPGHLQVPLCKS